MKSRSKFQVDFATVSEMTQKAGIGSAESVESLGAGEFNTVLAVRAGGKDYALKIAPAPWSETLSYERDMMRAEVCWQKGRILPCPRYILRTFRARSFPRTGS